MYLFAGKVRDVNLSKGNFEFTNCQFLGQILQNIEQMPDNTFEDILSKYVELNKAHPFREGNGRATRLWLDLLLIDKLKVCVDWSKIEKLDYLNAMEESVYDDTNIKKLIKNALTKEYNDRDIYLKGIDYSYYYEEID